MARKPERLSTEDDIKILNSFMSETQNNIETVALDESNLNVDMRELSQDNINLRRNLIEKNKLKNNGSLKGNRTDAGFKKSSANVAFDQSIVGSQKEGKYIATTELQFDLQQLSSPNKNDITR